MNLKFSVIIPARNLSKYLLDECLPAIDKQTYGNFEVIVLPNSTSQKINSGLEKKYPWFRIIPTGKITRPAEKRDIGAKKSRGNILAFIDDDAYPDKNWLTNALNLFQNPFPYPICSILSQRPKTIVPKIVAICGPGILPEKTNIWEKIFDEILKSWVGSGGLSFRFTKQKPRYVDDYPSMNFLIKKDIFLRLGGFNNDYWPGEDSKLCKDIVYKEKGLILYSPDVLVYHHRRNNLTGFLKQHASYGFHRGAFFAHGDRNSRRLSYLIPTFFVLYLFTLFALWTLRLYRLLDLTNIQYLISNIPLLFYLTLMFYLSFKSFLNTKNLFITILSPFILFITHIVYGIMFVRGFLTGLIKKNKIY